MGTDIFLGEPPADIKQWIIDHAAPAGHPETKFTLDGGTVKTHNIAGTLDSKWMADNGYYDDYMSTWSKTITQADIGNTVTSIGSYAFIECYSLAGVTIPNSVTSIGAEAFYNCYGLTGVIIPNSVTNIGDSAFHNCSGLTSVTIPDGVTSIGAGAFF